MSNLKLQAQFETWKTCIIVPTYNNAGMLAEVLDSVLEYTTHIIVVNDGSTDDTKEILDAYKTRLAVHHLPMNKGKGVALRSGFDIALEKGYERAITMDSDTQHKAADLPKFLHALDSHPNALLIGSRNMEQESVPGTSNFGHNFSNFWYRIITGRKLPDTQSGYRLYPLRDMAGMRFYTTRYELEFEVLVRLSWQEREVLPIPIDVYYPPGDQRITHFRKVPDFTRITLVNIVMIFIGLLWKRPIKFFRKVQKKSPREFFREYILGSDESNTKITLAIMLGLFIGVSPFWGYQIMLVILLCVAFRLNKVIALVAAHISIPPMIPLILYSSYKLGGIVMGSENQALFLADMSLSNLKDNFIQYTVGAFALGFGLAVVAGILSYILLVFFRNRSRDMTIEE